MPKNYRSDMLPGFNYAFTQNIIVIKESTCLFRALPLTFFNCHIVFRVNFFEKDIYSP